MSVNIKNNVEKDKTLLLFFLSKSRGGHTICRQKHLELPVVSYPLIEFFLRLYACGAGGRTVGRTVTWLPKFLGRVDYFTLALNLSFGPKL